MLTKSDFTRFLQCPKYLWLNKFRQDLLPEEPDAQLQRRFDEGYEVEKVAYRLFPGGVSAHEEGFDAAIQRTKALIAQGAKVIFQPTFSDYKSGLFCRADILKRTKDGEWELYEVKGTTEVKDQHIPDVAFQKACLEEAGLRVGRVFLILVNNQYVRKGAIEPKKLLKSVDVTAEAAEFAKGMAGEIQEALRILRMRKEPAVRILRQCGNPYDCPFIDYCWKGIPTPSIYDANLSEKSLNALLDEGIIKLGDVPEAMIPKGKRKFYQSVVAGRPQIERKAIAEWIGKLEVPIWFLDYETYSSALPAYEGYRPYQQIPFQYSLHVLEAPGGKLRHFEHLATTNADPVPALAKDLMGQIGPKGTVLAWNMAFEKGRNTEIAARLPKFAKFFKAVNARMLDLMVPIRSGLYVHPDFVGSASIKAVLPVMAPELSYEGLVTEDGAACDDWPKLVGLLGAPLTPSERATMKKRMLDYCGMDTFAMVRILEELGKIAKKAGS